MDRWRLSRQLWFMALGLIFVLIVAQTVSMWVSNQLAFKFHEQGSKILPATRKMTLIDMYHDGIRGAVYSGLYGLKIMMWKK